MSLIATLALAASSATATLPSCSWDRPGMDPFMGDVVAAVDRYKDIPTATRAKLKTRMQARQYDEIAVIKRDAIEGKARYAPEIRDMHFGRGKVCQTVSRAKWSDQHQERGLVYCEDGHCIIVPTVCRNVSRITRAAPPVAGAAQEEPQVLAAKPVDDTPLEFEAPAAGGAPVQALPTSFAQLSQVPTLGPQPSPSFTPLSGPTPTPPGGVPPLPPSPLPGPDPVPPVTPAVPEPSTWAMFGLGLLALSLRKKFSA